MNITTTTKGTSQVGILSSNKSENIIPIITTENSIEIELATLNNDNTIATASNNPIGNEASKICKRKRVRRKPHKKKPNDTVVDTEVSNCNASMCNLNIQDDGFTVNLNDSQSASNTLYLDILKEIKITPIKSPTSGIVLRIKQKFLRGIHTKRCKFSCRVKGTMNNASTSKDSNKSTVESKSDCNGSSQTTINSCNSFLQSNEPNEILQKNIGTTPSKQTTAKKVKQFSTNKISPAELKVALESGTLIQGTIRINAKNFHEAYVSSVNVDESDYFIQNILDRNRALDGDVVAIKLKNQEEWTPRLKTAYVVEILERVHPRVAVGSLQTLPYDDKRFMAFIPRDKRLPKIKIPIKVGFLGINHHVNLDRLKNILYKGRILDWSQVEYAIGELVEILGYSGDLESETCAILAEFDLNITPFPPEVVKLCNMTDSIPIAEFEYRQDLRKHCIFTIDPATARDLDDAVSCIELSNGNLQIGVHISDVSYYLVENSVLDKLVCKKGTSIYMVNTVYHMLPVELCLHCSLLPGKDKLAFSVFWEMTKSGEILNEYFARTIINSCVQLSYEHAQTMIMNPDHVFKAGELPQIFGDFTEKDLSRTVNYLQNIAVNLRKKRLDNGALRIDQTKLLFKIDELSGEPINLFVYENKEAHRLIEEFMLLANISVGTKIYNTYPDKAFLRCHEPPKMHMLVELQKMLKNFGIDLDISSSKSLQTCMTSFSKWFGVPQMAILNHLLAKPMVRARYFCAGSNSKEDFSHYALSVPIYTHFTSPIRRYADIMVHRLLSASLNYTEAPKWTLKHVTQIANNCNKQKYNAKCAGDASCDLYLARYIREHQPFVRDAVVIAVKSTSFEILVYSTGSVLRMFTNALGEFIECKIDSEDNKKLLITFNKHGFPKLKYEITLFSIVKVLLQHIPKTTRLQATLLPPEIMNSST